MSVIISPLMDVEERIPKMVMLKIQKRQNEMNHQILQDSIGLQKEVKILLGAIRKGKESGSMMGHSSKLSVKKCSRHEDSKEIEQVKMK